MYSISSYFFGKFLSTLPLDLLFPTLLSLVVYWMIGLNTSNSIPFFKFLLAMISLVMTSTTMGLFLGCLLPHAEAAVSLAPILIIPFMLFGGFFANLSSIPVWISWIQYISVFKWGFEAFAAAEFHNRDFYCKENQIIQVETEDGIIQTCPITDGDQVLQKLGLEVPRDYWLAIGILWVMFLVLRLVSLGSLVWQTKRALRKNPS